MPTVDASVSGDFGRIMGWADKYRRLKVRTNADTPHDAAKPVSWVLRASACAAPSICSSRATASPPSVR